MQVILVFHNSRQGGQRELNQHTVVNADHALTLSKEGWQTVQPLPRHPICGMDIGSSATVRSDARSWAGMQRMILRLTFCGTSLSAGPSSNKKPQV